MSGAASDRPGAADALALERIEKRWGRTAALDGASLTVRRGTLHAVLGENGAGKTTLLRVAFGMMRPDAGVVRLWGVERHLDGSRDAIALGVGMVHQHFSIVPAMTVAENVALGGRGRFDPRAVAARVRALGEATGLRLDPDATAGALGVAGQQRLEILKALARGAPARGAPARGGADDPARDAARLLILDEPAAVLAPSESTELLGWLRRWVDAGGTAVLITHKLRDALTYADDVTVLRRGRTVLTRFVRGAEGPSEAELAAAMVGAGVADGMDASAPSRASDDVSGDVARKIVAQLRGVDVVDDRGVTRLRAADLDVHAGHILGVAAVEGNGQRELLRVLAGRLTPTRGVVERVGRAAFIPEDRHRDALLLSGSLTENVALAGAGSARGMLPWSQIRARTTALTTDADVRGGEPSRVAASLSGGNQQKLVIARELDADQPGGAAQLVVAENPTRGLDIRAAAAVRARLRTAAASGAGVVLHSGDLDELFALTDRVVVVYDGLVRSAPFDRSAVGRLMTGAGL